MGCYNLSCSLSKIDLGAGDSVMVYPLVYTPHFSTTKLLIGAEEQIVPPINLDDIGVNGVWSHLLPFEAQYNDYGSFESESYGKPYCAAENFLQFLVESGVTDKDNQKNLTEAVRLYKEGELAPAMALFMEICHAGKLYISYSAQCLPVKMALVDKRVYDAIVENEYVQSQIKRKLNSILPLLNKIVQLPSVQDFYNSKSEYTELFSFVTGAEDRPMNVNISVSVYQLVEKIKNLEEVTHEVTAIVHNKYVQDWLSSELYHQWRPSIYAGQNYQNENMTNFLKTCARISEEKNREKNDEVSPTIKLKNISCSVIVQHEDGKTLEMDYNLKGSIDIEHIPDIVKEKLQIESMIAQDKKYEDMRAAYKI